MLSARRILEPRAILGSGSRGLGLPAIIDHVPSSILVLKYFKMALTCCSYGASSLAPYLLYLNFGFLSVETDLPFLDVFS